MNRPLIVANASGFFGDRATAIHEMVHGGPIDVLTGDYLAELTTMILHKARSRDGSKGYAQTFLSQVADSLEHCLSNGTKIVVNAGGLNPSSMARELRALLAKLGLQGNVAYIDGDDLMESLPHLLDEGHPFKHIDLDIPLIQAPGPAISANAYLGGWGIAEALKQGADIVVCPRVTDASLTVGPAAWWHGWERDDWDRLAGATVAGHLIECGPQVTGGIYSFIDDVAGRGTPGFPIAQIDSDGSSVITKHPNTGGVVSVGTVTAQLMYEVGQPAYLGPDVVTLLDTVRLSEVGENCVKAEGTIGLPPTGFTKVSINCSAGYRNTMILALNGLDIEKKAQFSTDLLADQLDQWKNYDTVDIDLMRFDRDEAITMTQASAQLRITVKGQDQVAVGRQFSAAVVGLVTGGPAGCFVTSPPTRATEFGVLWPSLLRDEMIRHEVHLEDGTVVPITPTGGEALPDRFMAQIHPEAEAEDLGAQEHVKIPLGRLFGARSGDKGPNVNIALWAQNDESYDWLRTCLSVDLLKTLAPEMNDFTIRRYEFPNVRGINFVVERFLSLGAIENTSLDAQGKSVGEFVRSRLVEVPANLARRISATTSLSGNAR